MDRRPSQIVRALLIQNNIAQADPKQPWRCVTMYLPDGKGTVDDIIAVVEKEDQQVGRYISDSNYKLDPHIQILVRGVGSRRTYDKMREIADFMDVITNKEYTLDGETFTLVGTKRTTPIQNTGIDATGRRSTYTIEYDLLMY